MSVYTECFGPSYSYPPGYIVELKENPPFKHRFGGTSWKVIDEHPVETGPVLLFVLDLFDPKLSVLGINSHSELPICSYINSNVWSDEQVYKVDSNNKSITLISKTSEDVYIQKEEHRIPVPFPERTIDLRNMKQEEYPVDEDSYCINTNDFFGGNTFFRVAGQPLWSEQKLKVNCSCNFEMIHVMSIGYENYGGPFQYLDNEPFFIGEGSLYAFFCSNCSYLKVISQSS